MVRTCKVTLAVVTYLFLSLFWGIFMSVDAKGTIKQATFGKMPDGTPVYLYTMGNSQGMEVKITNYGGIVVSLKVPDKAGHADDVILGFDSLDGFVENNNSKGGSFFDAIIGRYANRIAHGTFTLDGVKHSVPKQTWITLSVRYGRPSQLRTVSNSTI